MSFVLEPTDADTGWRIVGGHVSTPRDRGRDSRAVAPQISGNAS